MVAELCATLLNIAARFFSSAVLSRLKMALFGPPSPLAEQRRIEQEESTSSNVDRSSRIIGVMIMLGDGNRT